MMAWSLNVPTYTYKRVNVPFDYLLSEKVRHHFRDLEVVGALETIIRSRSDVAHIQPKLVSLAKTVST